MAKTVWILYKEKNKNILVERYTYVMKFAISNASFLKYICRYISHLSKSDFWLDFNLIFFLDDPAFTDVIRQAEAAIDAGVNPIRIYQVRSGAISQEELFDWNFNFLYQLTESLTLGQVRLGYTGWEKVGRHRHKGKIHLYYGWGTGWWECIFLI